MTTWNDYLSASEQVLSELRSALPHERIEQAIALVTSCLGANKPLLVCGNGGSASDASHIAGELVGRYLRERRALKVIALTADSAVLTAWANDYAYEQVFARQVEAYGEPGGILLAISTSGTSKNVLAAAQAAKAAQMKIIALTGRTGRTLAGYADVLLNVPSDATPLIQQAHICIYHFLCEKVEERLVSASS